MRPAIPLHQKQAGLAASKLGVGTSKKHRAFVASDEQWYNKIFDPSSDFILTWNRIFLFSCFVALFIDPLYFYVPKISYGSPKFCVGTDTRFAVGVTFFRSIADLLYVLHIIIKFRTAYINPSSTLRVFGRGDLVTNPKQIACKYIRSDLAVDVAAALPLPQVIWCFFYWFLFLLIIIYYL
jgi:cyclic nucleotide gated channel